jgi:hypothetical protein
MVADTYALRPPVVSRVTPIPSSERLELDWQMAAATGAIVLALTVVFGHWTASSVWAFPRFLVGVWLFFYVPGTWLLPARSGELTRVERIVIGVALGMVSTVAIYAAARLAGWPWVLWIWPAAALVAFVRRLGRRGLPSVSWNRRADPAYWWLLVILVVQFGVRAQLNGYYSNLSNGPDGTIAFSPHAADAWLHVPLTRELTHTLPPQAPFLAGQPLSYHFGSDLAGALLASSWGLSVPDLVVRYMPTFFLVFTTLAGYAVTARWVGSPSAGALGAALLMFGEDFAFIPGWLLHDPRPWSYIFFGSPTTVSFVVINPMLPAVGVLLCGLLCLDRYLSRQGPGWMWRAAFLFAALAEIKMFTGVHILVALGLAGGLVLMARADRALLKAGLVTSALMLPILAYQAAVSRSGAGVDWQVRPWPYVRDMLIALHWPTGVVFSALVGLPFYLVMSQGFRVLGVPRLLRDLIAPARAKPLRHLVAVFVAVGAAVSLLTRVTERTYAADVQYNNAIWFIVQSKQVGWPFAVDAIWQYARRWASAARAAVFVTVAVIAAIPAAQLHRMLSGLTPELTLRAPDVALVRAVAALCAPGEVAFAREAIALRLVMLTPCRAPYAYPARTLLDAGRLAARAADHDEFWAAWDRGETRWDILNRSNSRLLVVVDRDLPAARQLAGGPLVTRWSSDEALVFEIVR